MPNTPALVGEGMTAYCANEAVTAAELAEVKALLECFGKSEQVPEKLMDAVVGISGSSPAYVFLFIEALADAGVKGAFPGTKPTGSPPRACWAPPGWCWKPASTPAP